MAKLYFRYGTVGSAKTLNLIAVAHNYVQQGKAVVIAKPALDTRFGREQVASRAQLSKRATIVMDDHTVLNPEHFKNIHCLVVDEVQFLHPNHIETFRKIADAGCPVICYGLRTDFKRGLFDGTKRLLELADTIEEVKTTCYYCNRKAIFNLKLVDGKGTLSGAQVELGCEELYLPACSHHFTEKTAHEAEMKTHINPIFETATVSSEQVKPEENVLPVEGSSLSSKSPLPPPTDINTLTEQSRNSILALRKLIAADNGVDPETIIDEYRDPLDQQ